MEHYVLHCLRGDADYSPELDFVMQLFRRLIGQDVLARTASHADDGSEVSFMTMGTICIALDLKVKGCGKNARPPRVRMRRHPHPEYGRSSTS